MSVGIDLFQLVRPAVDTSLSVTRIGSIAQPRLVKIASVGLFKTDLELQACRHLMSQHFLHLFTMDFAAGVLIAYRLIFTANLANDALVRPSTASWLIILAHTLAKHCLSALYLLHLLKILYSAPLIILAVTSMLASTVRQHHIRGPTYSFAPHQAAMAPI